METSAGGYKITGGYTCYLCGKWVNGGEEHLCSLATPGTFPVMTIPDPFIVETGHATSQPDKMIDLLNRIVSLLEKIEYNTRH